MSASPLRTEELAAVTAFANGETAKSAARKLNTSAHVVNNHLQAARRVANAKTTTALVATALRKGWIK